jgi:hypothetical protein
VNRQRYARCLGAGREGAAVPAKNCTKYNGKSGEAKLACAHAEAALRDLAESPLMPNVMLMAADSTVFDYAPFPEA